MVGCLAASLVSTYQVPVATPIVKVWRSKSVSSDIGRCLHWAKSPPSWELVYALRYILSEEEEVSWLWLFRSMSEPACPVLVFKRRICTFGIERCCWSIRYELPLFLSVDHRAVDNQVYVATASPARDDQASYVAWGHSTIVSPWWVG